MSTTGYVPEVGHRVTCDGWADHRAIDIKAIGDGWALGINQRNNPAWVNVDAATLRRVIERPALPEPVVRYRNWYVGMSAADISHWNLIDADDCAANHLGARHGVVRVTTTYEWVNR